MEEHTENESKLDVFSERFELPWPTYPNFNPPTGTVLANKAGTPLPLLFTPLEMRQVRLKNRIAVSPMCMYSSRDGFMNNFHLAHLAQFAFGGAGLVMTEATAVCPEGRITPYCPGIWKDGHMPALTQVVDLIHSQGAAAGIQLAHAGRKSSTVPPFLPGARGPVSQPELGGWPDQVVGPSAIAYGRGWLCPRELSESEIEALVCAWESAARRADACGFDVCEIHAAHGYLLASFLSPLSNLRQDQYGGSLENRCRLLLTITKRVRAVWPLGKALFVRLSCTEWVDGGWQLNDTQQLVEWLLPLGVDLIDCSSGGNHPAQRIRESPGYQVPFASAVRKVVQANSKGQPPTTFVGAVGLIQTASQAEGILKNGDADVIFMARQMLREPFWALRAAKALKVDVAWPPQYQRAKL